MCYFIYARDALAAVRWLVVCGESPIRAKQESRAKARIFRTNTVQAFGEKWYDGKALHRSKSWRDNAKRWLEQDIYFMLGGKPVADVIADDVERFLRCIVEKCGAKSAHYARLMLAQVFKSLLRGLRIGNPVRDADAGIEIPKPKSKGRALTVKEIFVFLEAIDRYPS